MMGTQEKLKTYVVSIATCGGLGKYGIGGLLVVLCTVPFQLISQGVSWLFPAYWYVLPVIFVLTCAIIIQIALWVMAPDDRGAIVLGRSAGFMVALGGMAFALGQWKMMVGSILLFHVLAVLRGVFDTHAFFRTLERLPGVLGIITYDIIIGLFVRLVTGIGLYFIG